MTRTNQHPNLPLPQHMTQRFIDAFNADEAHWRKLEPRRRLRRKMLKISKKEHEMLDWLEFAATRPQGDCVGPARYPMTTYSPPY